MSHVKHMNEAWRMCTWDISYHVCIWHSMWWMSRCCTHVWVMSRIWRAQPTRLKARVQGLAIYVYIHTYIWRRGRVVNTWMLHITHIDSSCHTHTDTDVSKYILVYNRPCFWIFWLECLLCIFVCDTSLFIMENSVVIILWIKSFDALICGIDLGRQRRQRMQGQSGCEGQEGRDSTRGSGSGGRGGEEGWEQGGAWEEGWGEQGGGEPKMEWVRWQTDHYLSSFSGEHMYRCMDTWIFTCMYTCMYVWICVCIDLCIYTYMIRICIYVHIYICVCVCVCVCVL